MADNDPKSLNERRQAANSDPFAELSRIIGYAPQGGPDAAPGQPQSAGFADDLEMDMERELLGAFAQDVRPLPTPRFRPADGNAPAAQPAVETASEEQPDDADTALDDLGIALDLDAELAASLAETVRPAEQEPAGVAVEEDEADYTAAANDDLAPAVAGEAAKPDLDDAALAALLAAEFDGPANEFAASADAPETTVEVHEAVSVDATEEPALVADDGRHVVAARHADDILPESSEKPGLFDDFEAALLRSIGTDAVTGPGTAGADPLSREAAAGEVADEVITLPGDLAAWRTEAAAEPRLVIPEEPVAHHRDEPLVAPVPDSVPDPAEADFEDELAAAFGADIMAETRSAAQARAATQDLSAPEPAAAEAGVGIGDEPAANEQPEDLAVVAAAPEPEAPPAEVEIGEDAADEPAFELDLSELVTAEPEEAREVIAEPNSVVAEPVLAVEAAEIEPAPPAGEQPSAEVEEPRLASDTPAPVALDEAAGGQVDAGLAEEVEPAADAFEQAFLADDSADVVEIERAAIAETMPAQVVAEEGGDDHADLDRSLAASLAAEFADTDLFSDITLDIDEPVEAVAEPDDVPAEPAVGRRDARTSVATDAAEIDFEAAMAEVDADFSALAATPEVETRHVETAAVIAPDTSSALQSDFDHLLDEMQAQTAAHPQSAVEAAPVEDPFDLLASEDLFGQALREAAEDELSDDELQSEAEAPAPVVPKAAAPVVAASAGEPAPVEPGPGLPVTAVPDRENPEWAYGEWNVTRVAAAFSDIPREPEAAPSAEAVADHEVPRANAPAAASPAAASAMTAAPAPEVPSPTRDDPFAALAAMAARYKRSEPMSTQTGISEFGAAPRQSDARATQPAYDDDFGFAAETPRHEDVPDIQTVEIGDGAVALADDLDIPDLHFEDEPAYRNAAYDDLDAEFNSLISDMAGNDPRLARAGAAVDPRQQAAEAHDAPRGYAAAAIAGAMASQAHDRPAQAAPQRVEQAHAPANDAYDPFDDDLPLPAYEAIDPEPQPRRRGYFLASVIGGVALLGGVAAFAFSFGDGASAVPTLVKADAQPIKVRPENPGGTVVPHQDNKVYQTVAGKSDATLEQHKLLTTAEEPVDIAVPQMVDDDAPLADEDGPMAPAIAGVEPDAAVGKSEDRVLADGADTGTTVEDEVALVQPRKVRTMVVKSDGTLVPREEPAAVAQPVGAEAAEPEQVAAEPDNDATFTIPGAEVAAPAAKAVQTVATPVKAPVAPVRPADQPVDIVGGVRADQVASISSGGEWSMQIASQPSQAGAQAEYATLSKRYAKVLQGQPVNIVKAEIAGKGTFWRVRVPADSKAAATALCSKYKAAGGNCFVSR